MAFGEIATRPVYWFKDWGIRRSLRDQRTRKPALQNALARIPDNTALAIDILIGKDISLADRIKALSQLVASKDFNILGTRHYVDAFPQPPRFFTALAKQPVMAVSRVYSFWRHFNGPLEPTRQVGRAVIRYGNGLEAHIYDYKIQSYRLGQHEFNLLGSEPVRPCGWTREDAINALGCSYPDLGKKLVDVASEGFYSRADICTCVAAMFRVNFARLNGINCKTVSLSFKRDDFSAPITVTVTNGIDQSFVTEFRFSA